MSRFFVAVLLLFTLSSTQAETISVAVPANFLKPMQQIAERFEAQTGNSIILHSGSTGQLYAQAVNGAPFDIFLSADEERVEALLGNDMVEQTQLYTCGVLAFYSLEYPVNHINDLSGLTSIAIANPQLAPYGKAAQSALDHASLDSQPKIIYGPNIATSYQYALHKAVSGSFVAYSHVYDQTSGHVWLVPKDLYAPIKQKMALLKHSDNRPAVHKLYRYILSDEIQSLIGEMGYTERKDC